MRVKLSREGLVVLLLLIAFILPSVLCAEEKADEYRITGLKVTDVPNDNGTGLTISWKPLPKEKRIIEYRVYRGVNPDTLFYIGKIDVNLKTGVAGDSVYFYDSGWLPFVNLESPGRLKKEKGKYGKRTLYREFPRDISVNGPQLKNYYQVLGIAKEKEFLFHPERVEKVTEIEAETDTTYYSGLRLNQFEAMYKRLIPDSTYYYTVLAVDEARNYYPEAEPVSGVPQRNEPETPTQFYAVYVEDANRLQFEWKLPVESSSVGAYSVYILERDQEEEFYKFKSNIDDNEEIENPAFKIFSAEVSGYTDISQGIVDIVNSEIMFVADSDTSIYELDKEVRDYLFAFSYDGYFGTSFSDPVSPEISHIRYLPTVQPVDEGNLFKVTDRIEDKGDYNTISWGRPIATITNTSYLNDAKTKLLLNYNFETNKFYKIKNIYFQVYDKDENLIADINEFYQDNKIYVDLPEGSDPEQTLRVDITFKCNKELGEYTITQYLEYDLDYRSLAAQDEFYINKTDVHNYSYYIYKRSYYNDLFYLSKKLGPTQREYHDNINHVNNFSVLVGDYDAEKNLYLIDPEFTIYRLDKNEITRGEAVSTSVWKEDVPGMVLKLNDDITEYMQKRDEAESAAEKEFYAERIKSTEKQIDILLNNPLLNKADSLSKHKRRDFLYNQRKIAKRAYEYKLVISDGKGHFTTTDIYRDTTKTAENDSEKFAFFGGVGYDHFYPRSNWFKGSMLPALIATLIFGGLVFFMIKKAQRAELYIRPIAGIQEIDNAIGRATEMGRPILFVPGLSSIQDVATLAGLSILGRVAKKAAEYDTKILCPVRNYIVLPIAQEIIKEAHYEAGRPDSYEKNSAFFITTAQFAFVAGVNGIMLREKTATNFYMGMFWAEALIMTETGTSTGAVQIAGTDAVTQIPFFITTCDYTLIGEELYAASAYLAREPLMLGTLKGQDYLKLLIIIFIVIGTILSTTHLTFLINAFPEK